MKELQKLIKKETRLRKQLNEVNTRIKMIKMWKGLIVTRWVDNLINKISKYFNLEKDYLVSNARNKELMIPKRLIYYILRNKYNLPLANIWWIFRLNHASIIYWLRQFEKQKENNKYINDLIKVFYE